MEYSSQDELEKQNHGINLKIILKKKRKFQRDTVKQNEYRINRHKEYYAIHRPTSAAKV